MNDKMNDKYFMEHLEMDAYYFNNIDCFNNINYKHGIFDRLKQNYKGLSLSDIYRWFIVNLDYDCLMILYCEVTSAILDEKERRNYIPDRVDVKRIDKYEELRKLVTLEIQHKLKE